MRSGYVWQQSQLFSGLDGSEEKKNQEDSAVFDLNNLVDSMLVDDIHNCFFVGVSPFPDQELVDDMATALLIFTPVSEAASKCWVSVNEKNQ